MRTQKELELRVAGIQLKDVKLVIGREYPMGNDNLKFKYFGIVRSAYDKIHSIPDTFVHRFVLGKIEDNEVKTIAQVDILQSNLQTSPDGTVISNNETQYPMRIFFPMPASSLKGDLLTFNRFMKFIRYSQFLQEESK